MPAQTPAAKTAEHPTLAAALAAFQAELPSVVKGKKANVGQYSYAYADLADVMLAATPLLAHNGLSFTCAPKHQEGSYVLTGTLLHASGDERSGELPIMGRTMQEIGSSITYGRRYLLGTLTGLVTDDDDDGAAGNTAEPTRRPQGRQGARPADVANDAQRHAILTALGAAADAAGVPRAEVARQWAEQHGGESLNEATDMPALTATLDNLRTLANSVAQAAMEQAAQQLGATPMPEGESSSEASDD